MDRPSRTSEHTPLPTSDFEEDNDVSSMSEYSGDDESHRGPVMATAVTTATVAPMPRSPNGPQSDVAMSIGSNIQALPPISPHNSQVLSDQATLGASANAHFQSEKNLDPNPSKSRNLVRQARANCWPWELSALFISLISLMAIILILYLYEGHSLSNLPDRISINAIIAILSTAMKAALSVPVVEAISQAKWDWFHTRGRSLVDMEVYDQASRGPWGALRMLASVRWRHFSSLGAIIVVLALAIDPMLQQMISYQPGQTALTQNATLPVRLGYINPNSNGMQDVSMGNAVYSGLLDNGPDGVKWYCPSTNCTWPSYRSLAVCSKCVNMTTSIETFGEEEMSYPDSNDLGKTMPLSGLIVGDSIHINLSITPTTKSLQDLDLIIVDGAESDNHGVQGRECVLYWCISKYQASVSNNQPLNESSTYNESSPKLISPKDLSRYSSSLNISETEFWVDSESSQNISQWMVDLLSKYFTRPEGAMSLRRTSSHPIDEIFDWISKAMTAQLRRVSSPSQPNTFDQAIGTATTTEHILHIRWWWLALPILLIASTLVLQLATMVSVVHGQTALWKSSTLALLFHGSGIRNGLFPQAIDDLAAMEDVAKQMIVRLGQTNRGWDFRQEPPMSA